MSKSIQVIGSTLSRAKRKVESILRDIPKEDVDSIVLNNLNYKIQLKNGDEIRALAGEEINFIGRRYNKVFIDKKIKNKDVIYRILGGLNDVYEENPVVYWE